MQDIHKGTCCKYHIGVIRTHVDQCAVNYLPKDVHTAVYTLFQPVWKQVLAIK